MNSLAKDASQLDARLSRLSNRCALAVMLIGVLVMIGWLFGIESLKRVMPHLQSMKFNTALGFLLTGAGLRWRDRELGLGCRSAC